ncbi:MAG: tRNA (N6-threonylcarbamoyladenosine(37)-N6)-methyltransferase TrmO [Bacteroidales bacterium]|nr:tRNA (N6-threonylcarbamoyladenosine(37)-N6)-methyltransferase TrmO [Bacteroidales bacterium]
MDKQTVETIVIARVRSEFPSKFGIPRQSGLVPSLRARIVFEPEYRNAEALRGIEEFSHLWLIWGFSEVHQESWSPTVRPPRLGGNRRMGVFATRSPFRPNPIGLSCVELIKADLTPGNPTLLVGGADLMDGTPIYDIKPYLLTTDCHPEASKGFTQEHEDYQVKVEIPEEIAQKMPNATIEKLREVLAQDPRPAYHNDETRVYGFPFEGYEVSFVVQSGILQVQKVKKCRR